MTLFASRDLMIARREDGWDEPTNEPNPVLIAFRESLAAFPDASDASVWVTALDMLDTYGGFVHWERSGNVFHVLTIARTDQLAHARTVLERLVRVAIAT